MDLLDIIGLICAAALYLYVGYALLFPERF
ncbi:potassium-transporting ATPase subunit F [Nitratidesulfovibrio vulgaris]|uniref:K+-transporting ATPase, F subunit n=1 Tax=Nitratidesulfovibrio vulgaris (strain ATCC 29579 / DSM 644 / CCUG 34227 / NCIMB 8303 / VKM B-1760 / Hildenborough) TaxID=882 RepID=Q725T5_NITV2|nr:potassium-transporting ATPase subunit F [Nitratidesulfovibrio vulgaris]AAS97808.1 K+-transporting ATPase, F subunit [Nitratidesulfovibrio vulgaris str. Hildenborough]WCB46714.1 potassium-transporting ATPase subunit F [Nitratidesulfovibrio vulgaris]HBW14969.1 potassium-transporting ATPase subunit F [Desulfovibrio sp.]